MKKVFPIFAAACLLAACNSGSSSATTDSSATTSADTTNAMSTDTSTAMAPATDTSSASIKDSVITLKDGKVLISSNGNWAPLSADVTLSNGIKVSTKGELTKGGKKKKLAEGQKIDKDGQLTDANGKLVDNAGW